MPQNKSQQKGYRPNALGKENDFVLFRLASFQRLFLAQVNFHLPGLDEKQGKVNTIAFSGPLKDAHR